MNGQEWRVRFVSSNSPELVDRTDHLTVATTDPKTHVVYLSNELYGDFLMTVFIHELGHCAMVSFGLLHEIHRMVYPEHWVEMEEFICNFLADFGMKVFKIAFDTMGYDAWKLIPSEYERYIAA